MTGAPTHRPRGHSAFAAALLVTVAALAVGTPARAGEFRRIARSLAHQPCVHRVHVPFLWLARFAFDAGAPAGVHGIHMAVFEQRGELPGTLAELLGDGPGPDWHPLVAVHDRWDEDTCVWARPHGHRVRLLVLTRDDEDIALMQVTLNLDRFGRALDDPADLAENATSSADP